MASNGRRTLLIVTSIIASILQIVRFLMFDFLSKKFEFALARQPVHELTNAPFLVFLYEF